MKNIKYTGLMIAAALIVSCGAKNGKGGLPGIDDGPLLVVKPIAEMCGIDVDCKAGIAQGNASISGNVSVDAFFQAVIDFQAKANSVSGGIEAQLDGLRTDFGIAADADLAAELQTQFDANLEGGTDRSHLVGSAVTMPRVVKNLTQRLGFTPEQAQRLVAHNPRRAIGGNG